MLAILTVTGVLLFAAALGRRILRLSRLRFDGHAALLEELCFAAGLGLGACSFAVMAVGLAGRLRSPAVAIAALILVCLLIPDAIALLAAVLRGVRAACARPALTAFQWLLVVLIILSLLCGALSALAPPTSWDATVSHLKVPFLFLAKGAIFRIDDLSSNNPLNAVMLFMLAMRLGGDAAPALLHLAFMVLAGLAVFALALRYLSRTGALVAAAASFLMPLASSIGPEAGGDFPVVLYVILAFAAFVRWWQAERAAWAVLAAVCLALAAGTKYTGLDAVVLFCIGAAWKAAAGRDRAVRLLSHAAAALLIAVALASPWYIRNAVLTGNPVYPVLADTIPTRHVTAAWSGGRGAALAGTGFADLVIYPVDFKNILLFPLNCTLGFTHGIDAGLIPSGVTESPGPLLLAFVPLLLLLRPVPVWARLALGLGVGGFFLVVPLYPLFRYLLPFVVPCTLLVGHTFDLLSGRRWIRRTLCAAVAFALLLQIVPFAARATARFPVTVGLESRDAYLLRADDVYPMAKHAADTLPPRARVLYVGERMYHFLALGLDATMGMPLMQDVIDFPVFATPAALLGRIRELGFTHVIVNEAVLRARAPFALEMLRQLEHSGLRELARKKALVLYELTPAESR